MDNTSTSSITVNCNVDKDTFKGFGKFHRYYAHGGFLRLFLFFSIFFAFAILAWYNDSNVFAWIMFVVSVIVPGYSILSFNLSLKDQVKDLKLDIPQDFYKITFHNDGLHVISKDEKADYEWGTVLKVYQTKHSIYVYLTAINAFIVPLDNATNKDKLISIISSNIENKKIVNNFIVKLFY